MNPVDLSLSGKGSGSDQTEWLEAELQPHEKALRGYLRRQFPSVDADDIVQESYLRLLKLGAVSISSSKAYFFSVARNTACRVFRRHRLYSDIPVNELPDWRLVDDNKRDAASLANDHEHLDLVIEALDRLPGRCREIVKLVVLDGLTHAEIASRLGLAESTVRVQIARGIKRLRQSLTARGSNCR